MLTEKDRQHAALAAGFFSQLAVACVAGALLQLIVPSLSDPARTSTLLMTGFFLYGASHIIVDRAYGATS